MNALLQLVQADVLERTRRYSFLVMLGLVLYLGYLVNIGQVTLRLETYRGLFNSAWVGSMMTLVVNFLLGWFGFYLVKNSIARDYDTGVGQILATTPLSRPAYLLGKWLSNLVVLSLMVVILALAAVVMQLLHSEAPQIDPGALIAPFVWVALPFMALVASIAVFFESIRWLRGSFGNLVYFFLYITVITLVAILWGAQTPLLDWFGFALFKSSMAEAARAAYPAYGGGLTLSMVPPTVDIKTFYWSGVVWTIPVVLPRLATVAAAVVLTLVSSLFFDRFDSTVVPRPARAPVPQIDPAPAVHPSASPVQLSPLAVTPSGFHMGALFRAELRLLLKGLPWWWYCVALGLTAASLVLPLEMVRLGLLPVALLWPILVWSSLGSRESRFNTSQVVFSTPHPLRTLLPPAWLAGLLVAGLMGAGPALRLALAGQWVAAATLGVGLFFIPSLALTLGVWTGTSKAFEVVYALLWYLGPLNKVSELDYLGLYTSASWPFYLALSVVLLVLAILGRRRQLRS